MQLASNVGSFINSHLSVRIVASDSIVAVTWTQNGDVFFRHSTDGGATFELAQNLSNTPDRAFDPSLFPRLAINGSTVAVVWQQGGNELSIQAGNVAFRRSTDGGATFGPIQNLISDRHAQLPLVAMSSEVVAVVWRNQNSSRVFFRGSMDGGVTFSPIQILSSENSTVSLPDMVVDGCAIHTDWSAFFVSYRRSIDCGATFEPIKEFQADGAAPLVTSDGSTVVIVWRLNTDIVFANSFDGGMTFGTAQNISQNSRFSFGPQVAISSPVIGVVWVDRPPAFRDMGILVQPHDIFFRRATAP